MNYFVGLDSSLRHTGVAVFNERYELVYQTTINTRAPGDTCVPYVEITNAVTHVLRTYKPHALFLEEMFQSRSGAISKVLFRAQYACELAAHQERVPYYLVRPTDWQSYIIGAETKLYRGIVKVHTRKRVEKELGLKFVSEHAADAGCIALCGIHQVFKVDYRVEKGLEQPLKELPKVMKPERKKKRAPRKSKTASKV